MKVFTVSFFGHRRIYNSYKIEERLETIIKELLSQKEYVEFLVGRNGDFDFIVSSAISRIRKEYYEHNSSLVLILPYMIAEYRDNIKTFSEYYDEIEISLEASNAHYKSAIRIRNKEMVDRSDLVICYVENSRGGAYNALCYAKKKNKVVINLFDFLK